MMGWAAGEERHLVSLLHLRGVCCGFADDDSPCCLSCALVSELHAMSSRCGFAGASLTSHCCPSCCWDNVKSLEATSPCCPSCCWDDDTSRWVGDDVGAEHGQCLDSGTTTTPRRLSDSLTTFFGFFFLGDATLGHGTLTFSVDSGPSRSSLSCFTCQRTNVALAFTSQK